ncbi:Sec23-binding domain of Sec16-domain-containing protein [Dissophora ornata]|nr:Sec23-binding domain of Sec16-domain-containing protein [Dissophora ornata]
MPQAQHTPSAPPLPNQRQQIGHQYQQQQQQQQSHSRQASISTQAPPPQRYSLSAQSPQGIQQQPLPGQSIAQQLSFARVTPGTPRHGPIFGPPSASPHTSYVQPRTPLLSATQASSIALDHIVQSQQSTPSLTHTPYMGSQQSQFGSTTSLLLQPCPFSECAGENKPQAKFCSECGRSIAMASRSATPSLTTGHYVEQQYAQQEQIVPEQESEKAEPEPERIDDPLNRQSGCPLIAFGFGGRIMTWFPSAYNPGIIGAVPNPRALTLQRINDHISADAGIASFPGPLLMDSSVQMKNKRKDVSKLIEDKINRLGKIQGVNEFDAHRVLIWKLFKVMIEQEGTLVGGAKIDEAVRSVLQSIPLAKIPSSPVQQESSEQTSVSIDALQEMLRQGDLAASVRHALDSHLWAHALIISSHGDRELWKEAVNGFMKHELSSRNLQHANGRESLRVLYKLFSGQSDRAVSELVPDNLRAQYLEDVHSLSKHAKIPDDSLAQWRDTLTLILSNRTVGDQETIHALGDMLVKEGWVEAAHICYLLSPQVSVHSGPDTPRVSMVLLGAEHNPHSSFPYYKNMDAFQKTEIYEFACALKSSGATGGLPFLQAYKLVYVWSLLDGGMFSEAGR